MRSTMDRGRREGRGRCMFVGAAVISLFVFIVSCVFVSFLCVSVLKRFLMRRERERERERERGNRSH
jgi:membrane protein implicated in regulation of membrane protease activity